MKRIKPILWVTATVSCAAVAFSAGQLPPVNPGEKILNSACTTCHELRPIETTALDREGWTKIVDAMVEKGAEVKKDDVPVLVRYLAFDVRAVAGRSGQSDSSQHLHPVSYAGPRQGA